MSTNFTDLTTIHDQSLYFLGRLFGDVGGLLPSDGTSRLIGTMFGTFNSMLLVIGAFIIVYVTVVGLLKTAAEGEFLGKQWNSLWVPLRTVFGIAGLFPTSSGYCALQVAVMWIIIQGVSAADALWSTALGYTSAMGSPFSTVSIPMVGVNQKVTDLYKALVCDASARRIDRIKIPTTDPALQPADYSNAYYCADADLSNAADPKYAFCSVAVPPAQATFSSTSVAAIPPEPSKLTYNFGPGGACGSLTYGDKDGTLTYVDKTGPIPISKQGDVCPGVGMSGKLSCAAYTAQDKAVKNLLLTLGDIAQRQVAYDFDYLNFYHDPKYDPQASNPVPAQAPDWVQSYCAATANSISPCCRFKNCVYHPASTTNSMESGFATTITTPARYTCDDCTMKDKFVNAIKMDNGVTGGPVDEAAEKLYWPYAMQPYLGQQSKFIDISITGYVKTIENAVNETIQNESKNAGDTGTGLKDWQAQAKNTGWILAGSYYYKMAQSTKENYQDSIPDWSVTVASKPGAPLESSGYAYRNSFDFSGQITTSGSGGRAASKDIAKISGAAANAYGSLSGTMSSLNNSFQQSLTGNAQDNPLASLFGFGEGMLITVQILYPTIMIGSVIIAALTNINVMAMGFGLTANPLGAAMNTFLFFLIPMLLAMCAFMITFGSLLAIYTPLIPYVIFTFGAIGWFFAVIEAMVAAPLVALGILSPGGQHEILGRSEPALLLLFNIFLRPSLMIFGMMLAMLLAPLVVRMINAGFNSVVFSMTEQTAGGATGILEMVFYLGVYVTLILTALNKVFSLIHFVPERAITWIGGHAVSYGEEQSLGAIKSGSEAVSGAAAGGVQSSAQRAGKGLSRGIAEKKEGEAKLTAAEDAKKKAAAGTNPPADSGGGTTT